VTGAVRDGDRVIGVLATDAAGATARFDATYIIDASGRDAIFAHESRAKEKIATLDQTAVFAHYTGVPRQPGLLAGDIDIVIFRESAEARPNWFWIIPFKNGTTSVGAVVSRAWIKQQRGRRVPDGVDDDATSLFRAALGESRTCVELLGPGQMAWPAARAAADFSYRVRELVGNGWVAVGDAGGFIDPLFSTGVHLAICGGNQVATVLLGLLALEGEARRAREVAALEAWAKAHQAGAETFILAVQAFYAGPLMEMIFAENKHNAIRRSITSLLAGDVFSDAVWLRDARRRIAEMMGEASAARSA
jgi:flavin-dependent dehydrogenase